MQPWPPTLPAASPLRGEASPATGRQPRSAAEDPRRLDGEVAAQLGPPVRGRGQANREDFRPTTTSHELAPLHPCLPLPPWSPRPPL